VHTDVKDRVEAPGGTPRSDDPGPQWPTADGLPAPVASNPAQSAHRRPLRRISGVIVQGVRLVLLAAASLVVLAVLCIGGYVGWELGRRWFGTTGGIVGVPVGALVGLALAMAAGSGAKGGGRG